MTTIEMRVHMDCPGCESKVRSTLQKLKGIDNVEIDMPLQKVTVTGWADLDQKKVLKTVRKTGRRAELWQFPLIHSNTDSSYVYNQSQCNGPIQGRMHSWASLGNCLDWDFDLLRNYSLLDSNMAKKNSGLTVSGKIYSLLERFWERRLQTCRFSSDFPKRCRSS